MGVENLPRFTACSCRVFREPYGSYNGLMVMYIPDSRRLCAYRDYLPMAYYRDVFEEAIALANGQRERVQNAITKSQPKHEFTGKFSKGPVQCRKAPFIKGPIPLEWFIIATGLSRGAAKLASALWYRLGLTQGKRAVGCACQIVRVDKKLRTACKIKRWEVGPGIRKLEKAGLVRVVKSGRGRCPVVEVLEVPPT